MSLSRRRPPVVAGLLLVAFGVPACGGIVRPDCSDVHPFPDMAGGWFYSASSGGSFICGTGVGLELTQSGSQVDGTYTNLDVECVGLDGTLATKNLGPGRLQNARIGECTLAGWEIEFDFSNATWNSQGVVNTAGPGPAMTGSFTATVDFGGTTGQLEIDGNWRAAK